MILLLLEADILTAVGQANENAELQAEVQSLRAEVNEVDAGARDWASAVEMADAITCTAPRDLNTRSGESSGDSSDTSEEQVVDEVNGNLQEEEWPKPIVVNLEEKKDVDNRMSGISSPLGERDLSSSDSDDVDDYDDHHDVDEEIDDNVSSSSATATDTASKQQNEVLSCVAPEMADGGFDNSGARAILRVEDYKPRSETER